MSANQANKNMVFENQLLSARLEIREYFLNGAVRSIYDNIGQALSLVMVNLSLLEAPARSPHIGLTAQIKEVLDHSREVLGESIRDLRTMAARFTPENKLATTEDFIKLAREEIKQHFPPASWNMKQQPDISYSFSQEHLLIAFSIILLLNEVFIRSGSESVKAVRLGFEQSGLQVTMIYDKALKPEIPPALEKRIRMLAGKIKRATDDPAHDSIILHIPLYNLP